jgi:hypothetical protein
VIREAGEPAVLFGISRARRYADGRGRDIARGTRQGTKADGEERGRA